MDCLPIYNLERNTCSQQYFAFGTYFHYLNILLFILTVLNLVHIIYCTVFEANQFVNVINLTKYM